LAYWRSTDEPSWYYQLELASEVGMFFGQPVPFTGREKEHLRTQLRRRLNDKAAWNDPALRAQKEEQRRGKKAKGRAAEAQSGYVNLRTEAGMDAAIATAAPVPALAEFDECDEAVTEDDRDAGDEFRGVDARVPLLALGDSGAI